MYEQSPVTKRTRDKLPPAVQPFVFSFKAEPSPYGSPPPRENSEDTSLPTSNIASPDTSSSAFSPTDTNSSSLSPEASCSPESDKPDESDLPAPNERSNTEMQLMPFREESPRPHQPSTESTFSFHPHLQFPSIPRPLRMPWSSSAPERFQVSDTTSSELDLSWCVFPLFGCSTQAS